MVSGDVIATSERVVRDSIIKVCCKGCSAKVCYQGFTLFGGGGVGVHGKIKKNTISKGLGKISIDEEALQFVIWHYNC